MAGKKGIDELIEVFKSIDIDDDDCQKYAKLLVDQGCNSAKRLGGK